MQVFLTVLIGAAVLTGAAALCVRRRRHPVLSEGAAGQAPGVRTLLLSLAGGLLLFFALESAVCRRVGPDLFLPVQAGQAMPLRVLRLGVCLLLALALGTDPRSRKLSQALDRLCQKNWGRWLVSFLAAGLAFLWTTRVSVLRYLISDDPVMLQTIASIPEEGLINATHTFSEPLFAIGMSWFYKVAPDGYWYPLYQGGMPFLVMWLLGWSILTKCRRHGRSALLGCAVFAVFSAGVFCYIFGALTFTLTAGMAGTGAVILALCRSDRETWWGRLLSDAAGAVLMLLCLLQRESCGQALFCFWALAMGYQLIKTLQLRERLWPVRAAAVLLAAALTVAFVDKVSHYSPVWDNTGYRYAETYRSRIEDYLIDQLREQDFEAVGICPELATLLHFWFFMDPLITTDNFRNLEYSLYTTPTRPAPEEEAAAPTPTPAPTPEPTPEAEPAPTPAPPTQLQIMTSRLTRDTGSFLARMTTEPIAIQLSVLALILLLASLVLLWRSGLRYWLEALVSVCAVGGGYIMCMYLTEQAYFPLRAFQVILFPAASTELLMLLSCPGPSPKAGRVRRTGSRGLIRLCAAGAAAACFAGTAFIPYATVSATRADVFGAQWALENYARENPDITIVNNAYNLIFDPIHTASDYPDNLVWWGGCGDTAKPMEERLFADAFFRDDVQFMTDNAPSTMYLLQYLTLEFGPVQANTITRLEGGISIFDIDQILPDEPDYTGWYECNDLTYYFRDGKAVTGTQYIDGKRYTFAASGQSSQYFACFTDDTLAYSTYAYSLITDSE